MVSEDIAAVLELPAGGRAVNVAGTTGRGGGRMVDVQFRFPQTIGGERGLEVTSS